MRGEKDCEGQGIRRGDLPVDPSGQTSVVSTMKIFSMPIHVLHCSPGSAYFSAGLLVRVLLWLTSVWLTYQPGLGFSGGRCPPCSRHRGRWRARTCSRRESASRQTPGAGGVGCACGLRGPGELWQARCGGMMSWIGLRRRIKERHPDKSRGLTCQRVSQVSWPEHACNKEIKETKVTSKT